MLSIPDMALLGAAALLLFGPEQLPRVARKAGNVMREIQNTSQSFIREMERAADLQDEAAKPPYEPPAYEPVPYDAAAYEDKPYEDTPGYGEPYGAKPYGDASTVGTYAAEPPEPDPERPAVAEKLAEPRPALHLLEADAGRNGTASPAPVPPSDAAEPAPQADHPAHL